MDTFPIKECPRRFLGDPVVRYVRLNPETQGWSPGLKRHCAIIMTAHSRDGVPEYNVHKIAAGWVEDSWDGIQGWYDLPEDVALEVFNEKVEGGFWR